MAAQLETTEHVYNQNQKDSGGTPSAENQVTEDRASLELLQAEASFSQLLLNTSLLYNHSVILIKKMQQVFGHSFLAAFTIEIQPSMQDRSSAGFIRAMRLDHILDSVIDLGKNVLEEFSSSVADVFEGIQEAEEYFQQSSQGTCHVKHCLYFMCSWVTLLCVHTQRCRTVFCFGTERVSVQTAAETSIRVLAAPRLM